MNKPWPKVRLVDVLHHRKEFIRIDDLQTYRRPKVRLHVQGIILRDEVLGALIKTKSQQVCRAGEFLVAEIDAKVGGFGIVPDALDSAIVSSHYFLFVVDDSKLDRRFLGYFIRTPGFREQVEAQGSTNYAAIRPADLLRYEILLPPLDEQRRIVKRIEELDGKIEEARALRKDATVEAEAIMASVLGDRFSALASKHSVRPLGELTSHILDGPHVTPHYLPDGVSGIPFVTVKNITKGKLDFHDINYISEQDHKMFTRRCKPERGDILYSKDGATRGRPCLVDTDREFSYFVSVALIKPIREVLHGRFLVHLLNSNWIKDRMSQRSRGDMIPHIVLREIRAFPVPALTISDQIRVIAELNGLQEEVDGLKGLQVETAAELDALLPAVLDRAFKGEL